MMKKKYTPFAADNNNQLLVEASAVMHPMIPLCDGLPITFFKGDSKQYLQIDVAIDWCRKEMQHHSKDKYEHMIAVMEKAKQQFAKEIRGE